MCVVDAYVVWVSMGVHPGKTMKLLSMWVTGEGTNSRGGVTKWEGLVDWQDEGLNWDQNLCACCCGGLFRKSKFGVQWPMLVALYI